MNQTLMLRYKPRKDFNGAAFKMEQSKDNQCLFIVMAKQYEDDENKFNWEQAITVKISKDDIMQMLHAVNLIKQYGLCKALLHKSKVKYTMLEFLKARGVLKADAKFENIMKLFHKVEGSHSTIISLHHSNGYYIFTLSKSFVDKDKGNRKISISLNEPELNALYIVLERYMWLI